MDNQLIGILALLYIGFKGLINISEKHKYKNEAKELRKKNKKLEDIRLKYEGLQCHLTKILKAKDHHEAYALWFGQNMNLEYGTRKKLHNLSGEKQELLRLRRWREKESYKTCGTCEKFCGNDHCVTKE